MSIIPRPLTSESNFFSFLRTYPLRIPHPRYLRNPHFFQNTPIHVPSAYRVLYLSPPQLIQTIQKSQSVDSMPFFDRSKSDKAPAQGSKSTIPQGPGSQVGTRQTLPNQAAPSLNRAKPLSASQKPQVTSTPKTPSSKPDTSNAPANGSHTHDKSSSSVDPGPRALVPVGAFAQTHEQADSSGLNLTKEEESRAQLDSELEIEHAELANDFFDYYSGNAFQRMIVIGQVYSAILHTSATNQQLSDFFEKVLHIYVPVDRVYYIRRGFQVLSSFKDFPELDNYLFKRPAIKPDSRREERRERLARNNYRTIRPMRFLGTIIAKENSRWRNLDEKERNALKLQWSGLTRTTSIFSRVDPDESSLRAVPMSLSVRLAITAKLDRHDKRQMLSLIHLTDSLPIEYKDQSVILTHVYITRHYYCDPEITPPQLLSYFQSYYSMNYSLATISKVHDRVSKLLTYRKNDEELLKYIDNCGPDPEELPRVSPMTKFKHWRDFEKTARDMRDELGEFGRQLLRQELLGFVSA